MKTKLLFLFLLSLSLNLTAQQTYVPDDHFENYLETHDANGNTVTIGDPNSMGNGIANDDYVTTAKINTVTYLDVSYQNISDLTGIRDFSSLIYLLCFNNNLTALDVSMMGTLKFLQCNFNQLTSINLIGVSHLKQLGCYNNQLSSLQLDDCTQLKYLYIHHNQIGSLDVSHNPQITELSATINPISQIDVSNLAALQYFSLGSTSVVEVDLSSNPLLTTIFMTNNSQLERLNIANGNNSNLTTFNVTSCPSLTCIQVDDATYMDTHFPNAKDPTASYNENCHFDETYIPDSQFENYLENHYMGNGISGDHYVTTANINWRTLLSIPNLNISDLTGIEDFTALQGLFCQGNHLTVLDMSQNVQLETLVCDNNNIAQLNIAQNAQLRYLSCKNNDLTQLDVTQNPGLTHLYAYGNQLSTIDLSNNSTLWHLDLDFNVLTSLDVSANTQLLDLDCGDNQLTQLDVSQNPMLEDLLCFGNQLTSLNLVGANALQTLNCRNNQLTQLDVSQNPQLTGINCDNNAISELDLSANHQLAVLFCRNNQLESLNMANGNNTQIGTYSFKATGNPNLTCVQVDDASYMSAHFPNAIDAGASYNENCHYDETYVPDDNFEQFLEYHNMGNGIHGDDYVTTLNIRFVPTLIIAGMNISDLTGIEDFKNLHTLDCSNNNLSLLDVSHNTQLTYLNAGSNHLNVLDVTSNPLLEELHFPNNQITTIDLSQNNLLTHLGCGGNSLAALELTANPLISVLYCAQNQIQELFLEDLHQLTELHCENNQLQILNIKNGNNIHLTSFNATGNPQLSCVQTDDETYMNNQWSNAIDPTASYAEVCPYSLTYVPDSNLEHYLETHDEHGGLVNINDPMNMGNGIDNDQWVYTIRIAGVRNLDVQLLGIADMTGIEDFTALEILYCSVNQITQLNLENNTLLQELYCFENQITQLDLSLQTQLVVLKCNNNQLNFLDMRNGNNTNVQQFSSINNPNLSCIFVDDPAYSSLNWTNIDPTSTFVSSQADCDALSTPVFEEDNFAIYPNPAKSQVTITAQVPGNYSVFSISGKELQKGNLVFGVNQLNISKLSSGIYLIKVQTERGSFLKKLIIE